VHPACPAWQSGDTLSTLGKVCGGDCAQEFFVVPSLLLSFFLRSWSFKPPRSRRVPKARPNWGCVSRSPRTADGPFFFFFFTPVLAPHLSPPQGCGLSAASNFWPFWWSRFGICSTKSRGPSSSVVLAGASRLPVFLSLRPFVCPQQLTFPAHDLFEWCFLSLFRHLFRLHLSAFCPSA